MTGRWTGFILLFFAFSSDAGFLSPSPIAPTKQRVAPKVSTRPIDQYLPERIEPSQHSGRPLDAFWWEYHSDPSIDEVMLESLWTMSRIGDPNRWTAPARPTAQGIPRVRGADFEPGGRFGQRWHDLNKQEPGDSKSRVPAGTRSRP